MIQKYIVNEMITDVTERKHVDVITCENFAMKIDYTSAAGLKTVILKGKFLRFIIVVKEEQKTTVLFVTDEKLHEIEYVDPVISTGLKTIKWTVDLA